MPVTLEVLNTHLTEEHAYVDVRVLVGGEKQTGLTSEAFTLLVNGQQAPVAAVEERSADDPVCVIAVLDDSGSVFNNLAQMRAAVQVLNDLRKPGDRLGLTLFAETAKVHSPQTPSDAALNPELVTGQGNYTALWDGIVEALAQAEQCATDARYLIVVTDGGNNQKPTRMSAEGDNLERARRVAELADEADVSICTIGVQSAQFEEEPLKLAAQDCKYSEAASFDEVATLFQDIFGFVRGFYRIEVPRTAVGGAPDAVRLRVLNSAEVDVDF